jgi:hypothetical protein
MRSALLLLLRAVTILLATIATVKVFTSPMPQPHVAARVVPLSISSVAVGSHPLADQGIPLGRTRTVVFILRAKDCADCDAGTAIYRRVATACRSKKDDVRLIVLSLDPPHALLEVLAAKGIGIRSVYTFPRLHTLGISGVPSTLILDGTGAVLRSWSGALRADQEVELVQACRS